LKGGVQEYKFIDARCTKVVYLTVNYSVYRSILSGIRRLLSEVEGCRMKSKGAAFTSGDCFTGSFGCVSFYEKA